MIGAKHPQTTPTSLPRSMGKAEDTQRCRNHQDEQVNGGEMGEEEKQNGVGTMKGGRTGDTRVLRNNMM